MPVRMPLFVPTGGPAHTSLRDVIAMRQTRQADDSVP